jgi:WD40 repeat protein
MDTLPEGLTERDQRLGEIVFSCLEAIEQGQPLDHREVLARHPEFAAELTEFFAERADLQRLAAPLREVAQAAQLPWLDQASTLEADASSGAIGLPTSVRFFGDYDLLEVIGRGGDGVVYKARQRSLNRVVALKVIQSGRFATETHRQRFQNEAEAAAELDHPQIVPIYAHGEHDGLLYYSMKLIGGGSLAERIAACRAGTGAGLEPRDAARLVATVARAVHYAHQRGILHRDLKPANIILGPAPAPDGEDAAGSRGHPDCEGDAVGVPYVTDFGLAKRLRGDSSLTPSGDILGTPNYMAPEQAAGGKEAITTAADIYGLGAILYALLTGQPPFQADTVLATLRRVIDHDPEPPSRRSRGVDRDLETICLKCLHKDPQRRYASAEALARDLERWLTGEPIHARRIGGPERLWKWAKRRPAIAALSGLLLLFAAVGLIGIVVLYNQAVVARAEAVEFLRSSEASLYTNRIALADRYRQAHDADRADELLDDCPASLRDWEWRHLKRRHFEEVMVYADHDGPVRAVAFSPDGRYLVSIDAGRNIHVRDRATCRVLDLPGIPIENTALALSPDGRWMAVGGHRGDIKNGAIKLWSTKTWSEVKSLPFVGGFPHALAFSPDSRRLVAGHEDDMVRLWDVATGNLHNLPGHRKAVQDVAFSPDGRLLASASRDATIRVWDAETYELRATLPHQRPVFSLSFHPQGRLLVSATGDIVESSRGDLTLWDLDSAQVVRKTSALGTMVAKVRFSPEGRRLATAGVDRVVRIWVAASLHELLPLTGHDRSVSCLAFSPDGHQLVSGAGDGRVRCWNAAPLSEPPRHQPVRTFSGHDQAVYALAVTPDGQRLVSAGDDHTARVWDVESGRELLTYRNHGYAIISLAVRPDGQAVATGGDGPELRIWDLRTGADLIQLRGHTGSISALAFHPDGVLLASASQDGTVRLWDTRTGELLHEFLKLPSWLCSLAFTPDGYRLAAAGDDAEIHVWDVPSRRLLHVLRGHTQRVVALAFDPSSLYLASASLDGTVRQWDSLHHGFEVRLFEGVRGKGLAFSPDGQHFAVSGAAGSLKVWELRSGRRVLTLRGHTDDITSAVYTADGRRIVTAGWDRTIKLWDVAQDAPDLWVGEFQRLLGHPSHVFRPAVLPGGKRAISGGDDGMIRVWDIASGHELRRWVGSDPQSDRLAKIYGLAVTPDGERVVAGGDDSVIRVWEIESGRELRRIQSPGGAIFAIAITPDGRHALTGGALTFDGRNWTSGPDLDLHLWDLETGAEVRRFSGHGGGVWEVAISPDGRRAASASMDETVRVWDIDTGREVQRLDGHHASVIGVEFLPDGERLLSGGGDHHLRLWDIATGREIRRLDGPRGAVDGLAISPDGRHALSSGVLDHHLRLWDLDTGRELYRYEVPHVLLTRGTFTRDGRQAIWAGFDGTLRVWDIPELLTGRSDTSQRP